MFVDHGLWPPPPSDPPAAPRRRMTEREEKRLGWALALFAVAMVAGPLGGSSIVNASVAAVEALRQGLAR